MFDNLPQGSYSKISIDPGKTIKINNQETLVVGGQIRTLVINNDGADYVAGDVISISGGNDDATAEVTSVSLTGDVLSLKIVAAGSGYSTATGALTTSGTGTGLTVDVVAYAKTAPNFSGVTNSPAVTGSDPAFWATVALPDGSEGFIPVWK